MALPCPLRAVFTMRFVFEGHAHPNHKGSRSHPITPLVINSLGGGHTHTHTHSLQTKVILRNQLRQPKAGTPVLNYIEANIS